MEELKAPALVKISSPDNFKGFKLAVYMKKCKKDGGYEVYITDPDVNTRYLCIQPENTKDTITSITK